MAEFGIGAAVVASAVVDDAVVLLVEVVLVTLTGAIDESVELEDVIVLLGNGADVCAEARLSPVRTVRRE